MTITRDWASQIDVTGRRNRDVDQRPRKAGGRARGFDPRRIGRSEAAAPKEYEPQRAQGRSSCGRSSRQCRSRWTGYRRPERGPRLGRFLGGRLRHHRQRRRVHPRRPDVSGIRAVLAGSAWTIRGASCRSPAGLRPKGRSNMPSSPAGRRTLSCRARSRMFRGSTRGSFAISKTFAE